MEDFHILYHVHLVEDKPKEEKPDPKGKKGKKEEEEDEEEDEDAGGSYDDNKTYNRIVIPNISREWVEQKPQLHQIYSDIVKCIGEGLNAIQAFERWSRHNDMI